MRTNLTSLSTLSVQYHFTVLYFSGSHPWGRASGKSHKINLRGCMMINAVEKKKISVAHICIDFFDFSTILALFEECCIILPLCASNSDINGTI